MDNFMDKLVERINSQGAVRSQSMMGDPRGTRSSKTQMDAIESSMTKKLAEFEEKLAQTFAENVTAAVNESNARYVEMITKYRDENYESRLSATEELMAAQASSRESTIESVSKIINEKQASMEEELHKECVKVYKNIQAAIQDELEKNNDVLVEKIKSAVSEAEESTPKTESNAMTKEDGTAIKKKIGTTVGLNIFTIILLLANLGCMAAVLLWIFRII